LVEVHRIVCRDFREPLSVSKLAKSVGKHPVYLARVFKKQFGSDIKTYRDKLRLGYAFARKLNEDSRLTEIAHDSGFADQSHFNRKFKGVFGDSPRRALAALEV
jgi:AraC-like DNA-binding protein